MTTQLEPLLTQLDCMTQHQCIVYEGAPSKNLPVLAAMMRRKLHENNRCLYLNSPPMVAGMRSALAATGVDVAREVEKSSLVLLSDQTHLVDGRFDTDRMLSMLEHAVEQALNDGYQGIWASGDMTWEFGAEKNLEKLLEYEWRLDEFLHNHPALSGVCQYHADTLPHEVLRQGVLAHPMIFINETLSRVNPHYVRPEFFTSEAANDLQLEGMINSLCKQHDTA